jgi:putative nucleotidyltransferase with HDIG domain
MMAETVLFVDDEANILSAIERLFVERDFTLLTAGSAEQALGLLQTRQVSVLVSDHRMPGMSGIELLARSSQVSPDTIQVLMTAFADLQTAVAAINRSEIFRFVAKPWENEQLREVVRECLDRYRLVRSLRTGENATLLALAQAIELKDPYTKGHCERVAQYGVGIAGDLGLDAQVQKEIAWGGWLHDCGKIGVPEAILNFPGPLAAEQFAVIRKHPGWGSEVARQARLPQRVLNVIQFHHERFDGNGYPAGLEGEAIPLEARIIAVADVCDALLSDRPYRKRMALAEAMEVLEQLRGNALDPHIVSLFLPTLGRSEEP